jgi:hypothetical protein
MEFAHSDTNEMSRKQRNVSKWKSTLKVFLQLGRAPPTPVSQRAIGKPLPIFALFYLLTVTTLSSFSGGTGILPIQLTIPQK